MAELFNRTMVKKLVYVYRINDENHEGILKIGEASCRTSLKEYVNAEPNSKILNQAAHERIRHQTQTAGISYELLYTESTSYEKEDDFVVFQDHEVHDVLRRSGIKQKYFNEEHKANEWFYTDLETVKKAITAVKEGRKSLNASEISTDKSPIVLRKEQRDAIDFAEKQFNKKNSSNKVLWNAKMRFGKTLSALKLIEEAKFKRTLILTHRPVVDKGWFDDYEKIFYNKPEYSYGSKNNGSTLEVMENSALSEKEKSYIYFASIQDMRGSEIVGGKFAKNEAVFNIEWDFIIIDEAHEGTKTELGNSVLAKCRKKHTRELHLSGTPFNLMDDFNEDEIFTWDYTMEQRAKAEWDILHQGDYNPYACLPRMNIFTYDLGKLYPEYADFEVAFNFREFFRVNEYGEFVHETNIKQFLNLMTKEDPQSNYPFSTEEYRENFRHSLWMIPGVKEARALSKLLQEHPVFGCYEIVNVAGDGDEEVDSSDALKAVEKAMTDHPENTYTITLSCGRLTTGVSVKPWTACFMLSGSYNTAASTYMQTIFRVQTPATIGGKVKEECFVFDFAPDRTLKVIAEAVKISKKAGETSENDREILGEFINFCPIIGFDGSKMKTYDTEKMLGQLKKVYVERVVKNGFEDGYLYNDNLMKLDEVELKDFDELKGIIGKTKAMAKTGDIDINLQGFTNEEYGQVNKLKKEKRPLTPEEKKVLEKYEEAKKNRATAISILRGISIRMPLMIYGAKLNKNIDGSEDSITIDNFAKSIDDLSWKEFMPKDVTKELFAKFKKYYDPDIFREAGIKIRQMAKAADKLSIEERIERISMIFNTFRNPDKETVLTPWRVVNMHLTDCLGGWRFYDEKYTESITEPVFVEQTDVTSQVYKKNTKILEINSKSGLYALYCAYSVYRNRKKLELGPTATREQEKELWNKVLTENIYVICKTPMAKSITQRTLAGFTDVKVNAHYFEDLVNQLKNKPENFINKVTRSNYWKKEGSEEMKFDAVVGNPPYQEENIDNGRKQPVYNLFMDAAFNLSDIVSLITPARFLFNAGETPKDWNSRILNDEHFKVVKYWSKSNEVFPTVEIKGGVTVTLRNKRKDFGKIGVFTAYNELNQILHKVNNCEIDKTCMDTIVSSQGTCRFSSTLFVDYPQIEKLAGEGTGDKILSKVVENGIDVFLENHFSDSIQILAKGKSARIIRFINSKYIQDNEFITSYNVLLPESNGSGAFDLFSTPVISYPNEAFSDTFLAIGTFNTKEEAENCMKYIKSKFARAMLGVLKVTQHNPKSTWKFVPLQDFTVNSDIDWSKSVADIDRQLYAKYGLSEEEIAFIEKMIKPME